MPIVLNNAILAHIDPIHVEAGALRIDNGLIVERGFNITAKLADEVIDCEGCVVLPGMVNGHTHLYSALAVGMPPPPDAPQNFYEILKYVWWRLDCALDAESIEMSARIGALDALRCGTTTLIDHHASPSTIDGSLDLIENALTEVGLRGILCYETTDRHGPDGAEAGIAENQRYLEKCAERHNECFAGLVGAHASFTLDDHTLEQLATLAADFDSGVHIHVAEDPCDEDHCQEAHQTLLIDRLAGHNLIKKQSVFAHGTHLDPEAVARVNDAGLTMAHNARSNMNNAVGYAPVPTFRCPVMLGTDGIGSDMFAEARAAWFASCHEHAGLAPADIIAMLANSARRASRSLHTTLGKLEVDAAADIVITNYRPSTPLTTDNLAGHLLFGLNATHTRSVLINGEWKLREQVVEGCDATATRIKSQEVASNLWQQM